MSAAADTGSAEPAGSAEPQLGMGDNAELGSALPWTAFPPTDGIGAGIFRTLTPRTHTSFVTFRLADSLPRAKLDDLAREVAALPEDQRDRKRRIRIEHWLDAGWAVAR